MCKIYLKMLALEGKKHEHITKYTALARFLRNTKNEKWTSLMEQVSWVFNAFDTKWEQIYSLLLLTAVIYEPCCKIAHLL